MSSDDAGNLEEKRRKSKRKKGDKSQRKKKEKESLIEDNILSSGGEETDLDRSNKRKRRKHKGKRRKRDKESGVTETTGINESSELIKIGVGDIGNPRSSSKNKKKKSRDNRHHRKEDNNNNEMLMTENDLILFNVDNVIGRKKSKKDNRKSQRKIHDKDTTASTIELGVAIDDHDLERKKLEKESSDKIENIRRRIEKKKNNLYREIKRTKISATRILCAAIGSIIFVTSTVILYTVTNLRSELSPYRTKFPSTFPTTLPSLSPSTFPSNFPSTVPTMLPSSSPSAIPSIFPSLFPSSTPSTVPSKYPSTKPSHQPSVFPSQSPTDKPTFYISKSPSSIPSNYPSNSPTTSNPPSHSGPTFSPSLRPTLRPTSPHPTDKPTNIPTYESNIPQPMSFFVMGDVPYDENEAATMINHMMDLSPDADFLVHVGDMTRASDGCDFDWFNLVYYIMMFSPQSVFLTPGDNDWFDCPEPESSLSKWKDLFHKYHERHWKAKIRVDYQEGREENMAFLHKGVLYIFVHLIGLSSSLNEIEQDEWNTRHISNVQWTVENVMKHRSLMKGVVIFGHARPRNIHDDYFEPVEQLAEEFSHVPFIYIHGGEALIIFIILHIRHYLHYYAHIISSLKPCCLDGHSFDISSRRGITRIQVEQGANEEPLRITVNPFSFGASFEVERELSTKTSMSKFNRI